MAASLNGNANKVIVEGYATAADKDKMGASLARANKLREQLVQQGVDASRIVVAGKGTLAGRDGGARVFLEAAPPTKDDRAEAKPITAGKAPAKPESEPIGSSHFESGSTITVPKGTSAMVSILRSETEGEVVYLFDPESPRGNAQFPFRTPQIQFGCNGSRGPTRY